MSGIPDKPLAYNCSPSFNWRRTLSEEEIASFQRNLASMGYRFQFVTLAGFHALNASIFELAHAYRDEGMLAYSRLQDREFEMDAITGTGPSSTSRSSAPDTSTPSIRSSPPARVR